MAATSSHRPLTHKTYSFAGMEQRGGASPSCSSDFADVGAYLSPMEANRRLWQPEVPIALRSPVRIEHESQPGDDVADKDILAKLFPHTWGQPVVNLVTNPNSVDFCSHKPLRFGVVLSGGQAAGGHNVISGIFDYIKQCHPHSQLIGFKNGPHGVFTHNYIEITEDYLLEFRNMGGFHMICSGRHKIETEEQKQKSMDICNKLELHGLCIIGGDDSNTNGAVLAEYFKANGCRTLVVGAPKTIDGDLKNEWIETSFGFDTAIKVYSELVGNLCADAATSKDRYHFVRLMGRSASNISLEVAIQTRSNLTFVGEEVANLNRTLQSLADETADMIIKRAANSKNYGVVLLPEGLIEFVPEVGKLIGEINDILGEGEGNATFDPKKLSAEALQVYQALPASIAAELLLERDSHGNVQVAKIATERLLIMMTTNTLKAKGFTGTFIPTAHYFGYEGRCAMPSNFDANYCYALGLCSAALVDNGLTGYMATVRGLSKPASEWSVGGCPVTIMMNIERRKGKDVPVIKKYLVELDKPLFMGFAKVREDWKYRDLYRNPGAIQFEGPTADDTNFTIVNPSPTHLHPRVEETKCAVAKSLEVYSPLQRNRLHYRPAVANILTNVRTRAVMAKRCEFSEQSVENYVKRAFPLQSDCHSNRAFAVEVCEGISSNSLQTRVGIVLAGQPVPGAVNVVQGLFDRVQLSQGRLLGFKGISGLLTNDHIVIEKDLVQLFANQAGFEMLGRTPQTKHKLRDDKGLDQIANTCKELELTGLVFIGGQTTMTDAAVLTERFLSKGITTKVIGVPANQENNIKHPLIEAAIGFDTCTKTYASLIGNLLTDAASATKYWYFIRLMGNVPSHIVVECALQTHANMAVISEKYVQDNMTMADIVRDITDVVCARAAAGKNFGAVLIPEGVVSSIPQMKSLLGEIDVIMKEHRGKDMETLNTAMEKLEDGNAIMTRLTPWSAALLKSLPAFFRASLLKETPTGRIELSEIASEQLFAYWVEEELKVRRKENKYGSAFSPVCHYLGFQGRSAMPSNFDCALGVAHGYLAGILVESGVTGFLTSVRGLCGEPSQWRFTGVPLSVLMKLVPEAETNTYGRKVPMVPCADVDLRGHPYQTFSEGSPKWAMDDCYINPGPIQFSNLSSCLYNRTLYEEQYEYISMLGQLDYLVGLIGGVCSFGIKRETLKTAVTTLQALATILNDSQ